MREPTTNAATPLPTSAALARHAGTPIGALVLGTANYHSLAIIRSLGRRGVPVFALGTADSVGFYSRYLQKKWVCSDPQTAAVLLPLLAEIGEEFNRTGRRVVLFPTNDKQVRILSEQRATLPPCYLVHMPDDDAMRRCADKQFQCALAAETGVPVPLTYLEGDGERLQTDVHNGRLSFPVIFKSRQELPLNLIKTFRIIIIADREHLDAVLTAARRENITFLIQEIIPGGDDTLYTFGSCVSRSGETKAVFTGRKLRQRPPRFGECRVGESLPVPEIVRDGEKLLRGMNFFGISQVEFKLDARDQRYKLIEINPRAWSWVGLPVEMGVDIPYAFFCDALGVDTPVQTMPPLRAAYISLYDDLYWSLKAHDGRPWAHLFKNYDLIVEPYYTADDRKPGLIQFKRNAATLAGMAANGVLRKMGLKK